MYRFCCVLNKSRRPAIMEFGKKWELALQIKEKIEKVENYSIS